MGPGRGELGKGTAVIALGLLLLSPARAQVGAGSVSGTVTTTTGAAVPEAKVTVKNAATGQTTETQSDSRGRYTMAGLLPGEYEVSASAGENSASAVKVRLAAGTDQTVDLTVSTGLSLGDLGFSPEQTSGSAQTQALLNKRSHMLMLHQRFGVIAAVPMIATLAASVNAGGRSTSSAGRDLHTALGAVTGDLYGISAYYAIRAPKIPGTPARGPIRLHKILAWIHGPGMIMTPILGAMAFDQKSKGERVHGIASAHGPVAIVTAAAYGAAILSVSVKF